MDSHQPIMDDMKKKLDPATITPSDEVVVLISGADEGAQLPTSNGHESVEQTNRENGSNPKTQLVSSTEISGGGSTTSSPSKLPPRPPKPESLPRRRTLSRSVLSKPKSRFEEHPPPSSPAQVNARRSRSPGHGSPVSSGTPKDGAVKSSGTPKTPSVAADDDEEEEQEVYRMEQSKKAGRGRRRCCRARVLIEWMVLVMVTGCLVASLLVKRLERFVIWGLEIWKWCVMVMVVCCGRLFTNWLVVFIVFLIERNFLFKKKVLYFVYGLKNSFQVCIWFGLVLFSWALLFNRGVRRSRQTMKILNHVTRALVSLLVGSVIWLVKTLLVKLLASSFHVNRFFDRIQESVFNQYVLQTLSGPPVKEIEESMAFSKCSRQLGFKNMGKKKGVLEQGKIDVGKLHKMRQEKVSAWTMKGLMTAISSGFLTISNVIDDSMEGGGMRDEEITNEWEAKAVGYRIFKNVAKPGSKFIEEEDLLRFLSKEEVDIVFPMFEGALETGKIKKKALKNWVVKAYLNRKSLAHSLNDTKTAVKQVHKLATIVVIVVIIIISLLLMGFATTQVLVLISSQLLLVAFMFGNTCKTAFEAIIFVFVMHPFDVGDRCVIDGIQMTVEEMNILTTVFLRYDNEKIYYPNSVLATKPISNFYRSPDMNDSVKFSIDFFTSLENIAALKARIKSHLESKPMHWHPNHSVVVEDIVNVNKMNFALYVRHTMNFQNIVEKNSRRTELVLELKKIFEELSIQYHLLPQKVQLSYMSQPALPLQVGR